MFPTLFRDYGVCPVDHYAQALLATLRALSPASLHHPAGADVHQQIPAFYQLDAHLLRQKGVLEVRRIEHARGQQYHRALRSSSNE